MGLFSKPKCEVCAEVNPQPHTNVVIRGRTATVVQHPGRPLRLRLAATALDATMRHSGTPGWS